MKRIKMIVAYDGTNYCGWQIQPNGNTIEAELNKHLSMLLKEEIKVIGASRTDSGVHALCNIAVFDTNARMPGEKITFALNQRLPEDIRIQESKEVEIDYHPRHQVSKKTYVYQIETATVPLPTNRLYTHFIRHRLDVDNMQEAATYLVGEHDFKSFCSVLAQVESTVRTITDIQIRQQGNLITIQVTGNGFLYNMVRILAGTLIEVGEGKKEPSSMPSILEAKDRKKAGPTAPAKGLTLFSYDFLSEL